MLTLTAFLVRAICMLFLIQPHGFYKQADSGDYHNSAMSIATGHGMHRPDTHEPIFWRTPGYPPYLALFYKLCGIKGWQFEKNSVAQCSSIWLQIIVSSFIPIILLYLALLLTQAFPIALAVGWISVFHPGLVLGSTFLLTEGLALIFFYLFLLFLYRLLLKEESSALASIVGAAISLSVYTWMRPMGEFIGFFATFLLLIAATGNFKKRVKKSLLFGLFFLCSLSPWYVRNYQLTGEWFFCPTIGTYLNCFSVPKILRRTLDRPIEECHKIAQRDAARATHYERIRRKETGKHVSNNVCKHVAYPIIMSNPFYFMYDWIAETIKTTLDLYSYQLIPMIDDSYWYDPIEEYLPEKITACLWAHQMPWYGRVVCWAEFLCMLLLWIGLLGGLWLFVIRTLINKKNLMEWTVRMQKVWLTTIPLIGIIIGMTGGFGYARLRLPAEPLMIILSLTFWYWLYYRTDKELLA